MLYRHTGWLKQTGQTKEWSDYYGVAAQCDGLLKRGISPSYELLTQGQYNGSTTINFKTAVESKSNNVVMDHRTGLMWAKYRAENVGPASDGLLYWDAHVDAITHNGAGGAFTPGLEVTQLNTGAKGRIVYVASSSNQIWIESLSGTFSTGVPADTISDTDTGGPAQVVTYAAGDQKDIFAYVAALNYWGWAGHDDWRVPNALEMISLLNVDVDAGHAQPGSPFIFSNASFWTSSSWFTNGAPYVAGTTGISISFAWGGLFGTGAKPLNTYNVLPVRGPVMDRYRPCLLKKTGQILQARFFADDGFYQMGLDHAYVVEDAGQYAGNTDILVGTKTESMPNEVVKDLVTGLMWTRYPTSSIGGASDGKIYWKDTSDQRVDALEFCRLANTKELAGYDDWRLPNAHELNSILLIDPEGLQQDSDPNYFEAEYAETWTCTALPTAFGSCYAKESGKVWIGQGSNRTTIKRRVRLVRGGYTDADL